MLLSLSSQLYGYLPTNGQGNLGNVWWNDEEGKGSTFDEHPMRPLGELSSSANFSFLCIVRLFFVLSRFLLFSVKHIDTGASYQGDDKHAACKRQNQWTNKVSISAAPVVVLYELLASYFAVLYEYCQLTTVVKTNYLDYNFFIRDFLDLVSGHACWWFLC